MKVGAAYHFHESAEGMARRINRARQKDPSLSKLRPLTGQEVFLLEMHYRGVVRELYPGKGTPPTFDEGNDLHARFKAFLDKHGIPWQAIFRPVRMRRFSIDERLLRAETSNNIRLEDIYGEIPDSINREFTHPCGVKGRPVYLNTVVKRSSELQGLIRGYLRFVILPAEDRVLSGKDSGRIKVLASPPEGGRVLEVDEKVPIDGKPHTITLKGMGATRFAREHSAEMSLVLPASAFPNMQEYLPRLRDLPFLGRMGFLDKNGAIKMVKRTRILSRKGIDVAKVLALYEITGIPNRNGKVRPVAYYRGKGMICEGLVPVIMVRAAKSNFRLSDLIELGKIKNEAAIMKFIGHLLNEYRQQVEEEGVIQDYFAYLVEKVFRQKRLMNMFGIVDSANFWQNTASNISILGEELDVENLRHYSDFEEDRIREVFERTQCALKEFGRTINEYYPQKVDLDLVDQAYESALLDLTYRSIMSNRSIDRLPEKEAWLS